MFGTYGSTVIISTKHAISHLVEIELVERIGELYNCVGDDTNLANVICYKLLLIPQVFFLSVDYVLYSNGILTIVEFHKTLHYFQVLQKIRTKITKFWQCKDGFQTIGF